MDSVLHYAPMSNYEDRKFSKSGRWRGVRLRILIRDGWRCTTCGKDIRGKGQANVDHIIPRRQRPDLALSSSNLTSLCHACHSYKTVMRDGGMGKAHGAAHAGCDAGGEPLGGDHPWNVK